MLNWYRNRRYGHEILRLMVMAVSEETGGIVYGVALKDPSFPQIDHLFSNMRLEGFTEHDAAIAYLDAAATFVKQRLLEKMAPGDPGEGFVSDLLGRLEDGIDEMHDKRPGRIIPRNGKMGAANCQALSPLPPDPWHNLR